MVKKNLENFEIVKNNPADTLFNSSTFKPIVDSRGLGSLGSSKVILTYAAVKGANILFLLTQSN